MGIGGLQAAYQQKGEGGGGKGTFGYHTWGWGSLGHHGYPGCAGQHQSIMWQGEGTMGWMVVPWGGWRSMGRVAAPCGGMGYHAWNWGILRGLVVTWVGVPWGMMGWVGVPWRGAET